MATITISEQTEFSAKSHQPEASQHLLQIATGYVPNTAVWVAAELKVADLLAHGPRPVSELAAKTQTNEDALYRTLRLLAMVGIFVETQPRHFDLTPAAELLRSDHPKSMRDMVLWIADPFHFRIASELLHSVKTGQPTVEHVTGKPAFEYFATDPVEFDRFHRAMTTMSGMAIYPALEAYDFSQFGTIVDVAGGHGFVICEILRKHPNVKGVLFDLGDVVGGAEHRICSLALDGRCRTVAGDFFQSVPEGGDAYFMKHIIHDWEDSKAITILQNCRKALQGKPNGKVVLLDFVVPTGNDPHFSKVIDLEMLFFPGGKERSEEEFRELFAKAGLRMTRVVPTKSPFCLIEAEVA
jgi:O-methyltransferase domain